MKKPIVYKVERSTKGCKDEELKACPRCGKKGFDFDLPAGCQKPAVFSPGVGDWICLLQDSESAV